MRNKVDQAGKVSGSQLSFTLMKLEDNRSKEIFKGAKITKHSSMANHLDTFQ